jgi:hypothetical protein
VVKEFTMEHIGTIIIQVFAKANEGWCVVVETYHDRPVFTAIPILVATQEGKKIVCTDLSPSDAASIARDCNEDISLHTINVLV